LLQVSGLKFRVIGGGCKNTVHKGINPVLHTSLQTGNRKPETGNILLLLAGKYTIMKKLILFAIACSLFIIQSCDLIPMETVHGNGDMGSDTRSVGDARRIESRGFFDVDIVKGSTPSIKIDADKNLIPYILTHNEDGRLVIRTKEGVELKSDNKIKVTITTPELAEVQVDGSGNVASNDSFEGSENFKVGIAGSGNVNLTVNAPKVEASIAGSGDINLSGETRDARIDIAGNGNYKTENLKAENVEVHIAGSGNARVYASVNLDIHIAGSGDVYYKGSPSIKQSVAGSGNIQQIP
jgi:hypothetical protein